MGTLASVFGGPRTNKLCHLQFSAFIFPAARRHEALRWMLFFVRIWYPLAGIVFRNHKSSALAVFQQHRA